MPRDRPNAAQPVLAIATRLANKSTSEAWLDIKTTKTLLCFTYGNKQGIVDTLIRHLRRHGFLRLVAPRCEAKQDDCVFDLLELVSFGFNGLDLQLSLS